MESRVSRLSALPAFFRHKNFWGGIFDSKNRLDPRASHERLLNLTGSHRWSLVSPETDASLSASQLTVLDVAQGLLERGDWTVPSWRVEKWLAERCNKALGLTLAPISELGGSLGFSVVDGPRGTKQFQNALVTARWQCEATDSDPMEIWDGVPTNFTGSEAEKAFFAEVIVPSLGFPLLDYLRLQPTLSELGLDPKRFFGQRVDFAIDTGRGIRLVIEVDGPQHNDLAEATNDEDRDEALRQCGWMVWRVPTSRLEHPDHLREEFLRVIRHEPEWGFTRAPIH